MLFPEVPSETTSLEVFLISFAYGKEISTFIFYGRNFFPQQTISADVISEFSEITFLAEKHIGGRVITPQSLSATAPLRSLSQSFGLPAPLNWGAERAAWRLITAWYAES